MITNLVNGKRYIGMTIDVNRRILEHFAPCNVGNNKTLLSQALLTFKKSEFQVEILEEVDADNDLPEREEYWIAKLKPEYNRVAGGKGTKGMVVSEGTRSVLRFHAKSQWARMSSEEKEKHLKNLTGPGYGHPVSDETRDKLRKANLGKKQSKETVFKRAPKISMSMKGNSNGNKSISCVLNGLVVDTFCSVKEAAERVKCHPSSISQVLKGKKKVCKGFEWKYGV